MIKLILVDFDDTLYLSEEACFHLENKIAARLGFSPMTRKAHLANWGQPLKKVISERIPGIDTDAFMKLFPIVSHEEALKGTFDNIPEKNVDVIKQLKAKGYIVVIFTPREGKEIAHLISTNAPVMNIIDGLFYQERYRYQKPDPRVFLLPESVFKIPFNEMVYVSNTLSDVQLCNKAGVHFIASVENKLKKPDDFKKVGAKWILKKFTDLPNVVDELNEALTKEIQQPHHKPVI